jgi:hypothetical protein
LKEVRKVGKRLGKNPIDYLLPNGSLPQPVSGYFHPSHDPWDLEPSETTKEENEDSNPVKGIFGNLNFLLESYFSVLSAGGSIAVGTGYRSVARRLLERVEGIFARDLGAEGAGWPEVLEYLRGGRQRPFLCVLPVRAVLARQEEESAGQNTAQELAASVVAGVQIKPPMSKVKQWLEEIEQVLKASGPEPEDDAIKEASAEATEANDKMQIEIIEGILRNNTEQPQFKNFRNYLSDTSRITLTQRALRRLYHDHPTEAITQPIAALFLLLHPDLHPILQALANVTEAELDLINSGRFDAFLDGSNNVVARDEEEELATITALDRRLWDVLEGLEDEIEELRTKTLVVRRAIKSRKEIIRARQPTLASSINSISSRPTTPALEEEWVRNLPTLNLPITPDDSASNIPSHRRRKQERADRSPKDDEERRRERKKEKKERRVDEKKLGFSLKEFAIKSGEFGGTLMDGDRSDVDTLSSKRRRRRDRDRERSSSRHRDRRGECGSVPEEEEEEATGRERKERNGGREDREKDRKDDRERDRKDRRESRSDDKDRRDRREDKDKERDTKAREKEFDTESLRLRAMKLFKLGGDKKEEEQKGVETDKR